MYFYVLLRANVKVQRNALYVENDHSIGIAPPPEASIIEMGDGCWLTRRTCLVMVACTPILYRLKVLPLAELCSLHAPSRCAIDAARAERLLVEQVSQVSPASGYCDG